jgi:hypothetical protein
MLSRCCFLDAYSERRWVFREAESSHADELMQFWIDLQELDYCRFEDK